MIYLLHGNDEFGLNHRRKQLAAEYSDQDQAELNTTELNGKTINPGELEHHALAIPFLADRRLVIVHDFISTLPGGKQGEEEAAKLSRLATSLPESTILIFIEHEEAGRKEKSSPLASFMRKATELNVVVESFTIPSPDRLPEWIQKRTKEKGGKIDKRAAEALARSVGPNLRMLDNELDKLLAYLGWEQPITIAEVAELSSYLELAEDFGLMNAIGAQNSRKAIDQMHKELMKGEHPLALLARIAAQFRAALSVKELSAQAFTSQEIMQQMRWKSLPYTERRLAETKRYSFQFLQEALESILKTDVDIKTGRTGEMLALEMLIISLCSLAQK